MEKKIKVLNLYAGVGGNRKLWENVEVTAIEYDENIAATYKHFFPNDEVIVCDAHKYLVEHYKEFDFIWASPPCQSHSRIRFMNQTQNKPIYPDMKLYQEILFLKHYFKGLWVVENVKGFYEPLIVPQTIGSHYYWSNYKIPVKIERESRKHNGTIAEKEKRKGFDLSNINGIDKQQVLRNCVEPEMGLYVFECSGKQKQYSLNNFKKQMDND